jgi:hypothetical protein
MACRKTIHRYRELANIIPRRRLSLAAANLFSKSTSPTAWAAARNWWTKKKKKKKRKEKIRREEEEEEERQSEKFRKYSECYIFSYQEVTLPAPYDLD